LRTEFCLELTWRPMSQCIISTIASWRQPTSISSTLRMPRAKADGISTGLFLPTDVLEKVYRGNALKLLHANSR